MYRLAADALPALAREADPLAVDGPRRDRDVVAARTTGPRERDLPTSAAVRVLDRELDLGLLVGAADRTTSAPAPEQAPEQVLEVDVARNLRWPP